MCYSTGLNLHTMVEWPRLSAIVLYASTSALTLLFFSHPNLGLNPDLNLTLNIMSGHPTNTPNPNTLNLSLSLSLSLTLTLNRDDGDIDLLALISAH